MCYPKNKELVEKKSSLKLYIDSVENIILYFKKLLFYYVLYDTVHHLCI